eukprot:293255-Pyramimonas_sp.AAC.1
MRSWQGAYAYARSIHDASQPWSRGLLALGQCARRSIGRSKREQCYTNQPPKGSQVFSLRALPRRVAVAFKRYTFVGN